MKINSRKFLILSYALSGKPIQYDHLNYLWPDLSPGGRRSLIALLLKQRLISVQYEGKKASFYISSIGRSLIEDLYFTNTLHEAAPGFLVMLYPDVVLSEPKIAKLRALLKTQLSEVTPKLFFTSNALSDELLSVLKRSYFSCAAVLSVREWLLGEPKLFENYYLYEKNDENFLSGVSSEIEKLIEEKKSYSHADHQSNLRIFSLYDRVFTIIGSKTDANNAKYSDPTPAIKLLGLFSQLF